MDMVNRVRHVCCFLISVLLFVGGCNAERNGRDTGNDKSGTVAKDTALITAIRSRDIDEVANILSSFSNPHEQFSDIELYREAIRVGSFDLVATLVLFGFNVNAREKSTLRTPLHFSSSRSLWISRLLISNGADFMLADKHGNLPIHEAARFGNKLLVEMYSNEGVPLSVQSENGDTLLHKIFRIPCPSNDGIVRFLIAQGHKVNVRNSDGQTPLHLAATNCMSVERIEFLLEVGAKKSLKDNKGNMPLDIAKKRPQPAFSHFLRVLEE